MQEISIEVPKDLRDPPKIGVKRPLWPRISAVWVKNQHDYNRHDHRFSYLCYEGSCPCCIFGRPVIRPSVWSLNHLLKHWFGWGKPDTEVHADWGAVGLDGHEYVQHDEEEGIDDEEYEGNHGHCVPCTSLIFQEENCLTRTMTGTAQFVKGIGLWLRLNAK